LKCEQDAAWGQDAAEVRSVAVGGQVLRVAVRPGLPAVSGVQRVPLLLINGIGSSLELFTPFVDELNPAVEVIRFDPPGVGGSDESSGPYRFSWLCRLIARMLTELGYDRVDVLGISWGGAVAQHFARLPTGQVPPARPGGGGHRQPDGAAQAVRARADGAAAAIPEPRLPVPARRRRGLDQRAVPAVAAPADAHRGRG
jgi:pimeloyl-ACP methyl ester carboxylesterase